MVYCSLSTNDSHGSLGNDNTYAKVTARQPPTKLIQHINVPNKGAIIEESIMINDAEIANHNPVPQNLTQQDNVSSDGFIGVKRKRQSTKMFFLSGIADSVSAQDILSYLEKRDIKPTYLSLFKSIRKGTVSAKLQIKVYLLKMDPFGQSLSSVSVGKQNLL